MRGIESAEWLGGQFKRLRFLKIRRSHQLIPKLLIVASRAQQQLPRSLPITHEVQVFKRTIRIATAVGTRILTAIHMMVVAASAAGGARRSMSIAQTS